MYNVDNFNLYIRDVYKENLLFIYNNQIQEIVNDNTICNVENIEKLINKIMNNEFFMDLITYNVDYNQSYINFKSAFIKYSYNRFNYFFCNLDTSNTGQRSVVYFPLKYREIFYKKLCKLNELKVFL